MINPAKYRKNHELYGERLKKAKNAACARFTTSEEIPDGYYRIFTQSSLGGWIDMVSFWTNDLQPMHLSGHSKHESHK